MTMPAVFVSHGAPTLPFEDHGAVTFLKGLAHKLPAPRAILVISAHWETQAPAVSTTAQPETLYDFFGFPDKLYQLKYQPPGAPDVAERTWQLLRRQFSCASRHDNRGLDHGAWIPLLLAWPDAQIPTFQVSIQHAEGPQGAFKLGQALAPLCDEGVLILGSGAVTHNLGEWRTPLAETPDWVHAFETWIHEAIIDHRVEDLLHYRTRAPHALRAHPRDEHLLPLFAAMGAGLPGKPNQALYRGVAHKVISMSAWLFGQSG